MGRGWYRATLCINFLEKVLSHCIKFLVQCCFFFHPQKQVKCFLTPGNMYDNLHSSWNRCKVSKHLKLSSICKILTKYFMYILSMLKFVIVCLFSKRLKKLQSGRIFIINFPIRLQKYIIIVLYSFSFKKIPQDISACGLWFDYENFCPIVILSIF